LKFLCVQISSHLLVSRVLKVWSEQPQVIFFLFIVVRFKRVEFQLDVADQLPYFAGVNNAQVLIYRVGYLAANFFELLGGSSELAYLVDLEFFCLSFHFFEENRQVLWNLFRAH